MRDILNPDDPQRMSVGDTAPGVEIDTAWGKTTFVVASATFRLLDRFTGHPVPAFYGQTAAVAQQAASTSFKYAWNAGVPFGTFIAYFVCVDAGGVQWSTSGKLIEVS